MQLSFSQTQLFRSKLSSCLLSCPSLRFGGLFVLADKRLLLVTHGGQAEKKERKKKERKEKKEGERRTEG